MTVADWVQVGRFVLGLDPLTTIGGPATTRRRGTQTMSASRLLTGKTTRALSIDAATLTRGKAGTVCVTLNALGDESALGFSVHFDAKHLKFVSAKVVGAAAAATLKVNAKAAASGNLGVALMLPLPKTCKAGKGAVVEFTFLPLAAGATPLTFSDQVVTREIAGATAVRLAGELRQWHRAGETLRASGGEQDIMLYGDLPLLRQMTVSIIRWNWYRCQFLQCFRLRPVHRRCLFQLCHPSADGLRHSWYQSVCVLAGSPHSHDRAQCRFTLAPGSMSIVYLWRSCAQSAALVGVSVGLEA